MLRRSSAVEICMLSRCGRARVRRAASTPGDQYDPSWSPNGNKIAFRSFDDEIYVIDANGTHNRNPTWNGAVVGVIHADGLVELPHVEVTHLPERPDLLRWRQRVPVGGFALPLGHGSSASPMEAGGKVRGTNRALFGISGS